MPLPTLVLIPTSFCSSSLYDGQVKFLQEKGYSVHALDPPSYPASYKPDTPAPSMHDDANFIAEFVTKLANEGNDVVLLAHSYGGCPASQSLKGLTKSERIAEGKTGGVVRLAFLTAVVPNLGESVLSVVSAASTGGTPRVDTDQFGWMTQNDPEHTVRMAFNGLPLEQGLAWSKSFGPHAAPAFIEPLTYQGYQNLPVSWYFCEDDHSVVPEIQQTAISVIEQSWAGTKRDGKKVDITRNKCDHMPLLSTPDHLNAWIEKVMLTGENE